MQFGLVTNCLGKTTIDEAVGVAESLGFDCLEVGPSVVRDRQTFRHVQNNSRVWIHSFIYGRNFLTHNVVDRETYRAELLNLLDIALDVGVRQITSATGVDPDLTLEQNIEAALGFWAPILSDAQKGGVRIALEFCPTAGNFALGPYAWRKLLAATIGWPNFGLNYDPSHLLWQFIEPYSPLEEFGEYVLSVHAKDTVVWHTKLAEHGILTPYRCVETTGFGPEEARAAWWEYRLPGDGDLDWQRFFSSLQKVGFTGAVLLEHEAAEYLGSRERVVEGLKKGLMFLRAVEASVRESPLP